jgi:hypothetical protein
MLRFAQATTDASQPAAQVFATLRCSAHHSPRTAACAHVLAHPRSRSTLHTAPKSALLGSTYAGTDHNTCLPGPALALRHRLAAALLSGQVAELGGNVGLRPRRAAARVRLLRLHVIRLLRDVVVSSVKAGLAARTAAATPASTVPAALTRGAVSSTLKALLDAHAT